MAFTRQFIIMPLLKCNAVFGAWCFVCFSISRHTGVGVVPRCTPELLNLWRFNKWIHKTSDLWSKKVFFVLSNFIRFEGVESSFCHSPCGSDHSNSHWAISTVALRHRRVAAALQCHLFLPCRCGSWLQHSSAARTLYKSMCCPRNRRWDCWGEELCWLDLAN